MSRSNDLTKEMASRVSELNIWNYDLPAGGSSDFEGKLEEALGELDEWNELLEAKPTMYEKALSLYLYCIVLWAEERQGVEGAGAVNLYDEKTIGTLRKTFRVLLKDFEKHRDQGLRMALGSLDYLGTIKKFQQMKGETRECCRIFLDLKLKGYINSLKLTPARNT